MAVFKAFRAIRPRPELAARVSCLPYDVMSREEAKKMADGNSDSFLHVIRSEIDLDDSVDSYSEKVYEQARLNLSQMLSENVLKQDSEPGYYIYRQIMQGRVQTGLVGCASIDDYMNNVIKKHELTREQKELDRINHFERCKAHTEPVFLTYRSQSELCRLIGDWADSIEPASGFTSDDGVSHFVWKVSEEQTADRIAELFRTTDSLYIADGHHRSASSVKVGLGCRKEKPQYSGAEEFNYFLAVAFPDSELFVMDYNRVVKDLNGLSIPDFIKSVNDKFEITRFGEGSRFKPLEKHTFGMYIDKRWYALRPKEGVYNENDAIESLDVSILQNCILDPLLGIKNPRTDKRIDFVGGIRGIEELERGVNSGMAVAFALCPTSVEQIMTTADAGEVMPPKSTWFEPKLRSGLFVHSFSTSE